ncbi:MAG: hypothetical protein P0Y58_05090 [Candidatus Pseudomonas phytovorans]|uniref:Uncharacterized protein n=1 Tax=Candidatus Pseudomonas phytovorans TaxID=3121377 RepID=A0AAJ5WN31_9PSED|nr:hypothetical protein [Pseudomonas sp.]WEK31575.1 MAG: hypothetical protein P0Y58_05090 [Pseudomonas sp.]
MSSAPYDDKNSEQFEAVTEQLKEALRRLEKDSSLSASVSSLARLSGVHRNTIYNRQWPQEKLAEIKERRIQQKKDAVIAKAAPESPEVLLEQCRLEVIYWFTQLQAAREANTALNNSLKETESSRNIHMKLSQERLQTINKLTSEINKLQDALALQEEELLLMKHKLSTE